MESDYRLITGGHDRASARPEGQERLQSGQLFSAAGARILRSLVVVLALIISCGVQAARAQALLDTMSGYWLGTGRIEFEGQQFETLRCKAYYVVKGQAGQLNMSIHCAGMSYKIELRAQLVSQGTKMTGNWEERSFNVSGTAVGHVDEKAISLAIDGGGFSATMLVVQEGAKQNVSIATQGGGFKKVLLVLRRDSEIKR